MAIYQYKCSECGHGFEVRKEMNREEDSEICPVCGGILSERVVSSFYSKGSCSEYSSRRMG